MKGKEIYFYQGIDFIRDVEEEARAGDVRVLRLPARPSCGPVSGQMANEVVFKAVTSRSSTATAPKADPGAACARS